MSFTKPIIDKETKIQLKKFLNKNHHGEMKWLERHYEKKIEPKKVWDQVKTVVVIALNYSPKYNPILKNDKNDFANISVYAGNEDYHKVIFKKLFKVTLMVITFFVIIAIYMVTTGQDPEDLAKTLKSSAGKIEKKVEEVKDAAISVADEIEDGMPKGVKRTLNDISEDINEVISKDTKKKIEKEKKKAMKELEKELKKYKKELEG